MLKTEGIIWPLHFGQGRGVNCRRMEMTDAGVRLGHHECFLETRGARRPTLSVNGRCLEAEGALIV